MDKLQEIDNFYSENYYKLVSYLMNKKGGGDKVNVISDEAVDILHDCYCYHKSHPEHFDAKYVWNLFKQRRIDYLRVKDNYNSLKEDFFKNFYEGHVHNIDGLDVSLSSKQMSAIIKQEIRSIPNRKHKVILTEHIIKGIPLKRGMKAEESVVLRFKNKMVAKYGD